MTMMMMMIVVVLQKTRGQGINGNLYHPAKPGTHAVGQRRASPSPKGGPKEYIYSGGWQQSPYPSCPPGKFASASLLSPDGCEACPRGRIATALNLASADECKECPAGQYNSAKGRFIEGLAHGASDTTIGAGGGGGRVQLYSSNFNKRGSDRALQAECTPCPANSYGARPGLTSPQCSGKCIAGTYTGGVGGKVSQSDCVPCPPNYNGGGGQCLARKTSRRLEQQNQKRREEEAEAAAQARPAQQRSMSPEYIRLRSSAYHQQQQPLEEGEGEDGDGGVGLSW